MTLEEIREHLAGLTWPQGMTVEARHDTFEGPHLWIVWNQPDSFNPANSIDLGIRSYMSPNDTATPDALDRYVVWRISRLYTHEAREQIQRNGQPLDDPHATDALAA